MGLLDALIFGYRTVRNSSGALMPQRSRLQFTGDVTDDAANDVTLVDTGPGSPVSTLLGDGTVENGSHIVGDTLDWTPTDIPNVYIKEVIGTLVTDGDADAVPVTILTAANLNAYAVDVTATVWRPDGVVEKWKLTFTVSRQDGGAGFLLSRAKNFADATDQIIPTLSLDFSSPTGHDIAILFGDAVTGVHRWAYTARIHRHTRA